MWDKIVELGIPTINKDGLPRPMADILDDLSAYWATLEDYNIKEKITKEFIKNEE